MLLLQKCIHVVTPPRGQSTIHTLNPTDRYRNQIFFSLLSSAAPPLKMQAPDSDVNFGLPVRLYCGLVYGVTGVKLVNVINLIIRQPSDNIQRWCPRWARARGQVAPLAADAPLPLEGATGF